MSDGNTVPPYAVIINHEVADWAQWKAAFDEHEGMRRAAGILGHHINRGMDNPNLLSLYLAVADPEKTRAFAQSDDLKQAMRGAGVTNAPTLTWMTPVSENIVWDRELPAFIVTHPVSDFDFWLEGYQAADTIRRQGGIVGHAVNRSLDDPNVAIIYHQAESFGALTAFAGSPDLKAAMQKAGVTGPPQFSFVTGGWAKRY